MRTSHRQKAVAAVVVTSGTGRDDLTGFKYVRCSGDDRSESGNREKGREGD